MLPRNRFDGKLNGKTIADFISQLDYNLGQQERVKKVNEILNTQVVNGKMLPDKFFEEYFEQKDVENGIDRSHIKICLTKNDGLATDNPICKTLERMADYILYSPDGERINKKTKYNFYTSKEIFKKQNKEQSLEGITDGMGMENIDEAMDFLMIEQNYKKSIQQKIYREDLADNQLVCVKEYDETICKLSETLKIYKAENVSIIQQRKVGNFIRDMRDDQIKCKDAIKGTIYFKQPLRDSTVINYDVFDFNKKDQVLSLLRLGESNDFTDDLTCMVYDINKLIKKIPFNENYKKVLGLLRSNVEYDNIANMLNMSLSNVYRIVNGIIKKIQLQYKMDYEDWYYLNIEKGTYKSCKCCGNTKLIKRFRKRSDKKGDEYLNICTECERKNDKNRKSVGNM